MNTSPKLHEPFMFWLVRQFLPPEEDRQENVQPITDREFYSTIAMIIAALLVLDIIFHGLPL